MNLKEKWTKQNNSVKMLLRKLKRHDTVVVAVAVVIAVILCGGLIYLSTPVVAASAKDELVEAQTKDNEQTIEKLDELSEYLNGLDKSITESKDSMTSFYAKDGEKNTEKMTNTVTEKVGNLGKDFSSMHEVITKTESDIERLRELIEKGDAESGKSISENFTNIYNNLEEIENTYNKSQETTKELMEQIQKEMKSGDEKLSKELLENYKELLENLGKSSDMLTNQNSESLKTFKDEIGNMNILITNMLNDMSSEMSREMKNLDSSMSKGLGDLNLEMNSNFNNMSQSFTGNMTDLKNYLDNGLLGVNDKLDKVFQRVSNGKKLLASTLLTKNVQIREDATFAEISKAIESIPMKVVLDKDDIPGQVIYHYHYHVDGEDNICDEEYVPIERKGGCYTKEYVHTHTSACYNTSVTYSYGTSKSVKERGYSHDDSGGNQNRYYECEYCGLRFVNDNPSHAESTSNKSIADSRAQGGITENVHKSLNCSIPVGTLMGYQTTCNLIHGQIVAAKIVFSEGYEQYNTTTDLLNTQGISTSFMMMPQDINVSKAMLWDGFDLDEAEGDENFFLPENEDDNTLIEEGVKKNDDKEKTRDTETTEAVQEQEAAEAPEIPKAPEVPEDTGGDDIQDPVQNDNDSRSSTGSDGEGSGGDVTKEDKKSELADTTVED